MSTFYFAHTLDRPAAPSPRSMALLAIAFAFTLPTALPAAKAAKEAATKATKDSAPVLMSKTGGGDSWADVKELEQAVAKGNAKAETQYGEMLLRGDGIPKDEARGIALLEKAARSGNSAAAFRIGMLLSKGESGVTKDLPRALAYFRAAAAGGEAEAFYNIGAAYASGLGVKRDLSEALGWLIVARQHGAPPAAEQALRTQFGSQPELIAKGELRAKSVETEFSGKSVVELLPPPTPVGATATTSAKSATPAAGQK